MTESEKILATLEELKLTSSFSKNTLTLKEACAYTSISQSYMYKLTASCKIPYHNPFGKKLYFNKNELDSWLTSNSENESIRINESDLWAVKTLKNDK
ncbi:helix-turn-helix domain-containing protein [Flavobacteriaceae bacterium]|nr:helix-turn-helix domain-containing protein [Flavobacteriaceae bacterium]